MNIFYCYLCLEKTELALKGKSGEKSMEIYVVTYYN